MEEREPTIKECLPLTKCPYCGCYTATEPDYQAHQGVHINEPDNVKWYLGKGTDNSEVTQVSNMPYYAFMLARQMAMTHNNYVYTLSGNGKWIVRKPFF